MNKSKQIKRNDLIFNSHGINKESLLTDKKVMGFFESCSNHNTPLRNFLYKDFGKVLTISEYDDTFDFYYSFLNMSNINIIEDLNSTLEFFGDVTKGIKSVDQKYRDEYSITMNSLEPELKQIYLNFGYGKIISEDQLFTLFYMKKINVLNKENYHHFNLLHDNNKKEVNCVFSERTLYITALYPSCMMTVLLEYFKPDKIVIILTDHVRFREKSKIRKVPDILFFNKTISFNIDKSLIEPMLSAIKLKINK